jgi:hypothetical protein
MLKWTIDFESGCVFEKGIQFKANEIEGARSRIVSFNELENIENNVEVHYDDNFNPTSGLNSSVHSQGENFYGSGVYGAP